MYKLKLFFFLIILPIFCAWLGTAYSVPVNTTLSIAAIFGALIVWADRWSIKLGC